MLESLEWFLLILASPARASSKAFMPPGAAGWSNLLCELAAALELTHADFPLLVAGAGASLTAWAELPEGHRPVDTK